MSWWTFRCWIGCRTDKGFSKSVSYCILAAFRLALSGRITFSYWSLWTHYPINDTGYLCSYWMYTFAFSVSLCLKNSNRIIPPHAKLCFSQLLNSVHFVYLLSSALNIVVCNPLLIAFYYIFMKCKSQWLIS